MDVEAAGSSSSDGATVGVGLGDWSTSSSGAASGSVGPSLRFQAWLGAPSSSSSASGVSPGRPVSTYRTASTASAAVPRSPGWMGRYSPFGHQVKASRPANPTASRATTGRPRRTSAAFDHAPAAALRPKRPTA